MSSGECRWGECCPYAYLYCNYAHLYGTRQLNNSGEALTSGCRHERDAPSSTAVASGYSKGCAREEATATCMLSLHTDEAGG